MVHVHFEVYHALLNRPSLCIDYTQTLFPSLNAPTDDATWANKVVLLSARILQWSEKGNCTDSEWCELRTLVQEWEQQRPSSFDPFFRCAEGFDQSQQFPQLWFSDPCHG